MLPALFLFAALGVAQPPGEEQPKPALPGVKVNIVLSADAYDPSKPSKATVKCLAINKSPAPVQVRLGYDEQVNVLKAKGDHLRWEMRLYRFERSGEEPRPVGLKPGEEKVLFELLLDEVFLQRPAPQKKPIWRWDWMARPQAPPTPIQRFRQAGFVDKATFWAEALVNDKWLSSEPVVLKVVSPGGEEKPEAKE